MINRKRIYLDYAASTRVDTRVFAAMKPYFANIYGNPSSVHSFGQETRIAIDEARDKVAKFFECSSREVIFTGSATEANNLAIKGVIESRIKNHESWITKNFKNSIPHIVTSKIEHESVLEVCKDLEDRGLAEITYLPVTRDGFVGVSKVEEAIKDNTVLVSIIYANNEIGTIQPIKRIGKIISKFRREKPENRNNQNSRFYFLDSRFPLFHTDAVQAVQFLESRPDWLKVDLLTFSGHKIYGPKGIGVLYKREGVKLSPIIYGGGQEYGLRSGTENVVNIVGVSKAVEELGIKNYESKIKGIQKLRDKLVVGILKNIPGTKSNGSRENRLPNNANILFKGIDGESLMIALDLGGIAVSMGSACATRALEPSHTLSEIGLSKQDARSSLRFSLGKYTTEKEIVKVLKTLSKICNKLRNIQ